MTDIYRIPGVGMTPAEVRAALGVPEPVARESEPRDPFAPEEPYANLLGDQKSRNEQIRHDQTAMLLLGLRSFTTTQIGHTCLVSRECVRKRLVLMGVDRKLKRSGVQV